MTISVSRNRTVRLPHPMGYWLAVVIWLAVIASGMVDAASDGKGWHRYTLPDPYQVRDYGSGEGFWFTPPIAFLFCLPAALLLVAWGARTDRRWTVVVAALLSLPVILWNSIAMLMAVIPLIRPRLQVSDSVPIAG